MSPRASLARPVATSRPDVADWPGLRGICRFCRCLHAPRRDRRQPLGHRLKTRCAICRCRRGGCRVDGDGVNNAATGRTRRTRLAQPSRRPLPRWRQHLLVELGEGVVNLGDGGVIALAPCTLPPQGGLEGPQVPNDGAGATEGLGFLSRDILPGADLEKAGGVVEYCISLRKRWLWSWPSPRNLLVCPPRLLMMAKSYSRFRR
jgi:hypothetical protein